MTSPEAQGPGAVQRAEAQPVERFEHRAGLDARDDPSMLRVEPDAHRP